MFSLFKKKKSAIPAHLDEALLKRTDGKELAYVTERIAEDGTVTEKVLGKIGRINTHDGIISISCNGTPLFSCTYDTAECGELMSLAGIIVKGVDRETGIHRTLVAYYQYYRK